jgi:cytochrome d ubiquinol oxidase subunit II
MLAFFLTFFPAFVEPFTVSIAFATCVFFLALSLLAYALFGGADFGAGVVEITLLTPRRRQARQVLEKTLSPVWEANHIWLILAVVIVFMGFPGAYALISTALHLPITCVLLGIVARGTSFTFRHYDDRAEPEPSRPSPFTLPALAFLNPAALYQPLSAHTWYSWTFRLSSVWTAYWLGVTLAAMTSGRIPVGLVSGHTVSFYEGYVAPWWHWHGAWVGCFTVALFAFFASIFLIGESRDVEVRTRFARRARAFLLTALPLGAAVFLNSQAQGLGLIHRFLSQPAAIACVALSASSLIVLERGLRLAAKPETVMRRRIPWGLRLLAGLQGTAIVSAWLFVQYPNMMTLEDGVMLTLYSAAAPEPTLRALAIALGIGAALILPALFWLYRVFSTSEGHE